MVLVIGGDGGDGDDDGVGDGGDDDGGDDGDDDEMRGEKEGEDMVGVAGLPKGDVGTCSYKAPMIMVMTMMVMVNVSSKTLLQHCHFLLSGPLSSSCLGVGKGIGTRLCNATPTPHPSNHPNPHSIFLNCTQFFGCFLL